MKYFTPELYLRLQDFRSDEVMDEADAAWEKAAQRYRRYLQRIEKQLSRGLRFLQENFSLHDAEVLSIGRQEHTFVLVLRLDTPPRQLLLLNYKLTKPAEIRSSALMSRSGSGPVEWLYDEVALTRGKKREYQHSILLSNGWEVSLSFTDVTALGVEAVYPAPETMLVPVSAEPIPQSA